MKTIFSIFPGVVYVLLILLLLEQFGYNSYSGIGWLKEYFTGDGYEASELSRYEAWFSLLRVLGILAAGYLGRDSEYLKRNLLIALSVLLLNFGLVFFDHILIHLLSHLMVTIASSYVLIQIFLHILVFFPSADDRKDLAVTLGSVAVLVASILKSAGNSILFGTATDIVPFILIGLPAIIIAMVCIHYSPQIGYQITSEDTNDLDPHDTSWMLGICAWGSLMMVCVSSLNLCQPGYVSTINIFPFALYTPLLFVLIIGLLYYQFNNYASYSRHSSKYNWFMAGMVITCLLKFVSLKTAYVDLHYLSNIFCTLLTLFLIYPLSLSILTHLRLDGTTAWWLGVFFALHRASWESIVYFADAGYFTFEMVAIFTLFLNIAVYIGIRDNKERILDYLALDNTLYDTEDEPESDPLDHFDEF